MLGTLTTPTPEQTRFEKVNTQKTCMCIRFYSFVSSTGGSEIMNHHKYSMLRLSFFAEIRIAVLYSGDGLLSDRSAYMSGMPPWHVRNRILFQVEARKEDHGGAKYLSSA